MGLYTGFVMLSMLGLILGATAYLTLWAKFVASDAPRSELPGWYLALALAVGVTPPLLFLLVRLLRRDPSQTGIRSREPGAALLYAEPVLLGLCAGGLVGHHFAHSLGSLPLGLLMGVLFGMLGSLLGVPFLGAIRCAVYKPRLFLQIARPLATRAPVHSVGYLLLFMAFHALNRDLPLVPMGFVAPALGALSAMGYSRYSDGGFPFREPPGWSTPAPPE
jgi:hypothetical protein